MTNPEILIRSLIGPVRSDIRTTAYAVNITATFLFAYQIPMDHILVTKDIYPEVAKKLGKSECAVSRKIQRIANLCWDAGDSELLRQIIGKQLHTAPSPRDMLVYLAFYSYLDMSFYDAIACFPGLLF